MDAAILADNTISPAARLLYANLAARANDGAAPIAEILAALGLRTVGALRRLRGELAAAAILSSEVDGDTFRWQMRAETDRTTASPRAETDRDPKRIAIQNGSRSKTDRTTASPRAETDRERAETDRVTTPGAQKRIAPPPPDPPGRQVGRLINLTREGDLPTPPTPPPAERARSLKLLTAVGVVNGNAGAIADRWTLPQVAAFVAAYLADLAAGRVRGAGVLKTRCLADDATAPWLPHDDARWQHPLLRQHIADDLAAWRRAADKAQYQALSVPAAPAAPSPAITLGDGSRSTLASAWDMIRNDLRLQLPRSTYETWLRDAAAAAFDAGTLTIQVASPNVRDWLTLRLLPKLTIAAERILGPVAITIEVASCTPSPPSAGSSA